MSEWNPEPAVVDRLPLPKEQVSHVTAGAVVVTHEIAYSSVVSLRVLVSMLLEREVGEAEGSGAVMAALLGGTGGRMAHAVEAMGGRCAVNRTEAGIVVQVEILPSYVDQVLTVLLAELSRASPRPDEFRRARAYAVAEAQQRQASPQHVAAVEFAAMHYPPGDRRSRPTSGSVDVLARLELDVLQHHWTESLRSTPITVVSTGPVRHDQVVACVERARLPGPHTTRRVGPPRVQTTAPLSACGPPSVRAVRFPGASRVHLYVGTSGPPRSQPWSHQAMLAHVIGGAGSSRMDERFRDQLGWTYALRTGYRPRLRDGLQLTVGAVREADVDRVVREVTDVLDLVGRPITEEEVARASRHLTGAMVMRLSDPELLADEIAMWWASNLDATHLSAQFQAHLNATASGLEAAQRQLRVTARTFVLLIP